MISKSVQEPLLTPLQGFDLEDYLPLETMTWCDQYLRDHGFETPVCRGTFDPDKNRTHPLAYRQLRYGLISLMRDYGNDILPECDKPHSARFWRPQHNNDHIFREAMVGKDPQDIPPGEEELAALLQEYGRVNLR